MHFENYQKWLTGKLTPDLPEKSVLVIDNAPYHNVQSKRRRHSSSAKNNIQERLRSNRIVAEVAGTGMHKPRDEGYVI